MQMKVILKYGKTIIITIHNNKLKKLEIIIINTHIKALKGFSILNRFGLKVID